MIFFQQRDNARFDHLIGQFGAEAEVELDEEVPRDHVVAAGPGLDVSNLHAGRGEEFVTFIPLNRHQFAQHWRSAMNGVIGQMWISNMSLNAVNGQVTGQ